MNKPAQVSFTEQSYSARCPECNTFMGMFFSRNKAPTRLVTWKDSTSTYCTACRRSVIPDISVYDPAKDDH